MPCCGGGFGVGGPRGSDPPPGRRWHGRARVALAWPGRGTGGRGHGGQPPDGEASALQARARPATWPDVAACSNGATSSARPWQKHRVRHAPAASIRAVLASQARLPLLWLCCRTGCARWRARAAAHVGVGCWCPRVRPAATVGGAAEHAAARPASGIRGPRRLEDGVASLGPGGANAAGALASSDPAAHSEGAQGAPGGGSTQAASCAQPFAAYIAAARGGDTASGCRGLRLPQQVVVGVPGGAEAPGAAATGPALATLAGGRRQRLAAALRACRVLAAGLRPRGGCELARG